MNEKFKGANLETLSLKSSERLPLICDKKLSKKYVFLRLLSRGGRLNPTESSLEGGSSRRKRQTSATDCGFKERYILKSEQICFTL